MKGGFYSFQVFLPEGELPLPEASVLLEKGLQAFTAIVADPDALVKKMQEGGARVISVNPLGEHEPLDRNALRDVAQLQAAPGPDLLVENVAPGSGLHEEPESANLGGGSLPVDRVEPPADDLDS